MSEKTPEQETPEGEEPEDAEDEEAEDEEEDGDGEAQKSGKGKLIAIIAVALVVLLGGGGAAWYFGLFDSMLGKKGGSKIAIIELGVPVRHELPMIKADLKTGRCKSALVRTVIVVELGSKDLKRMEAMELRITDAISTYLRDYERQDMVGRKGSDKFRLDTTRIINNMIAPSRIQSLIFKEFIVQ
jgi:flagellar FliL protein